MPKYSAIFGEFLSSQNRRPIFGYDTIKIHYGLVKNFPGKYFTESKVDIIFVHFPKSKKTFRVFLCVFTGTLFWLIYIIKF